MSATNTYEGAILDTILNNGATPVATISNAGTHIAVMTSDPGETGSLTGEPSAANGYARVAVSGNFAAAGSAGSAANTAILNFGTNSNSDWGTLTHWALVTSGTAGAGAVILSGALTNTRAIAVGDQAQFGIGSLVITAD